MYEWVIMACVKHFNWFIYNLDHVHSFYGQFLCPDKWWSVSGLESDLQLALAWFAGECEVAGTTMGGGVGISYLIHEWEGKMEWETDTQIRALSKVIEALDWAVVGRER